MSWRMLVATILLVIGGSIELLAVLGLCVMRDLYDRMHYVGLAAFGAVPIAVGVVFRESFSLIGDKALLVAAMLITTGPLVAHVTTRSMLTRERGAWESGIEAVAEDEAP